MFVQLRRSTVIFPFLMLGLALLAGCGSEPIKAPPVKSPAAAAEKTKLPLIPIVEMADWCPEHGIPESICSMCSVKYADECKKQNDWCKEHERAKSQCFVCHPDLKEKFAKMKPAEKTQK